MMKSNPGKCHNRVFLPTLVNRLLVFVMLVSILFTGFSAQAGFSSTPPLDKFVYLPLVLDKYQRDTPKMVGVIAKGYWGTTTTDIQTKLKPLDTWAGKKSSIVGWFFDIVIDANNPTSTDFNFKGQLENLWVNGYVSFVNIGASGASAQEIANGSYDNNIRNIAQAYKKFVVVGGGRRAFVAPLQEMNGYWVSWGRNPYWYKAAYDHIKAIFTSEGIQPSQVWWTFAPNGYADPGMNLSCITRATPRWM